MGIVEGRVGKSYETTHTDCVKKTTAWWKSSIGSNLDLLFGEKKGTPARDYKQGCSLDSEGVVFCQMLYGAMVIDALSTVSPRFFAAFAFSNAWSRPTKMAATAQTAQPISAK